MRQAHGGIIRNPIAAGSAAAVALAGASILAVPHAETRLALLGLAGGILAGAVLTAAVKRWTDRPRDPETERAREAAEFFREFAEHSADWFWETDSEHRYVRGPLFAGTLHRLSFDAVVGLTREQLADPEDVRANPEKWRRHREDLDNRRPFKGLEYRLRRPDGRVGWVRSNGWPVFSEDGGFLGYRGTATDIDELRTRIAALAESEARFELAARAAGLGIWQWYPNSGRFLVSRNLRRLLGYRRRELEDSREAWLRLVHPEDRARVERAMAHAVRRGPGASFEVACRLRHKSGDIRWMQLRGHLPDLPNGSEPYLIGAVVDITERALAQRQLERRDVMMGHAQRLARLGSWECDVETRRMVCSETLFDILGVASTEPDLNLQILIDRVHPDDRGQVADALEHACRGAGVFEGEFRIAHPAGEKVVAGFAEPAANSGGRRVVYGVIQDVTAARGAERQLSAQNRRLRLAEEVAGIGHWQVDVATNEVIWSDQTYRIHGVSPETFELTLDSALTFYPPGEAEVVQTHLADAIEHKRGFEFELKIRRADGELRDVHSVGRCHTDASGNVIQLFGVFRDITESKRAEQALRESEEINANIIESALDAVITINHQGRIIEFNPSAESMTGYSRDQAIGQKIADLIIPPAFRAQHEEGLANYLATGVGSVLNKRLELPALRADGSEFASELTITVSRLGGEPIFIGYMRDITERKSAQAQLVQAQKMEAVGQLAGGIAHDFNNILTVVSGNLDLARRVASQPDRVSGFIDRAGQAAERAAELTKRLLAFSRKQVLEPRVLDVNEAVTGMRPLIQSTLGDPVEMITALADRPWQTSVDPHQLETALLNLAVNARDAMPDGGRLIFETHNVVVDETYARMEDIAPGDYVLLSVTDTGIGMPPEVAARVFEPFFSTKESGKGTGLGLSMVFGFVKQSLGHIKVYSDVGSGTTVKLYFPRHRADVETETVASELESNGEAGEVPRGSETVLVVDDDEAVRAVVVEILSGLGYRVREAGRGDEALAVLAADSGVDLLLTDVAMPGKINGIELAERAARLHPGLKVMLASGYAAEALNRMDRKDPAFAWISKPFDRARLGRKMKEVLNHDPNGREG